jgi:hypothetical protein
MATKKVFVSEFKKVIALIPFYDAFLLHQFKAGDEILGWDQERIELYSKRGVVEIIDVAPSFEVK